MRILIVNNTQIPALLYGGTERVIWWLGRELVRRGHEVTYLVAPGSGCPFADVLHYDRNLPVDDQVPENIDLVHLHFQPERPLSKPYLTTHHGNVHPQDTYDLNTVFVSLNHAQRNASVCFVHNGIDPDEYGSVAFDKQRRYLLFCGYAKRPEKNLKDCVYIARKSGRVLAVIGGRPRWYKWRPWLDYRGFIGGEEKNAVFRNSAALLFPVLWHEPCGLAVLEALYFGCPVIATPYGSLPELITEETGFLSNCRNELVGAVSHLDRYEPCRIHAYACDRFSAKVMTDNYLRLYEKVLNGETLNAKPPVNGGDFSRDSLLLMHRRR